MSKCLRCDRPVICDLKCPMHKDIANRRCMEILAQAHYTSVADFIENVYLQGAKDMAIALINPPKER